MHLNHRLKRLEQRVAPPGPSRCEACGLPLLGAPTTGKAEFEVGWHTPGETAPPPCPACGQNSAIWIEFDRAG